MKKSIALLTVASAALVLTACDQDDAATANLRGEVAALKAENSSLRNRTTDTRVRDLDDDDGEDEDEADYVVRHVGALTLAVTDIENDGVDNNPDEYSPVERAYSEIQDWPAEYYRAEIVLHVKNLAADDVDLTKQTIELTDALGRRYTDATSDTFGKVVFSVDDLASGHTTTAILYVVGKRRINLNHFHMSVGPQYAASGKIVGAEGTINFR